MTINILVVTQNANPVSAQADSWEAAREWVMRASTVSLYSITPADHVYFRDLGDETSSMEMYTVRELKEWIEALRK